MQEEKKMRLNYNENEAIKENKDMEIVHNWTWASDKICKTCYHYSCGFCTIDDTRTGENNYCSCWRP